MKGWRITLLIHVIGWLLFLSLPLIFLGSQGRNDIYSIISTREFWIFSSYYAVLFYLHGYVLLPLFYQENKRWLYLTAMALCIASVFMIQPFEKLMSGNNRRNNTDRGNLHRPPPPADIQTSHEMSPGPPPPEGGRRGTRKIPVDIVSIILFAITVIFNIAIDLSRRWRMTERRYAQAETDKATAELAFLKAQINPHFLFNTLNNLYSMAVMQHENTPATILKLSNIMRYVTDDVHNDFVSLQSEIDCIGDYIDLQKLRLNKKGVVEYKVTGTADGKNIAPMILMSFVENVFKYGTSNHEETLLKIKVDITDRHVHFYTENPLFPVRKEIESTGIGIDNTQKRLAQLYPGKHALRIAKENGLFTVTLSLDI